MFDRGPLEATVLLTCGWRAVVCWEEGSALGGHRITGIWGERLGNQGSCSAWCPCKHGMWVVLSEEISGAMLNERGWDQVLTPYRKGNKWNPCYLDGKGVNSIYVFPSVGIAGRNLRRESFVHLIAVPGKKLLCELLSMPRRLRIKSLDIK